jgi:hypothetical protein
MHHLLLAAAIATAAPSTPVGSCRLFSDFALVCTTPRAAVWVFENYGRDLRPLDKDYVRELIHNAGCTQIRNIPDFADQPLLAGRTGRIATADGWVPLTEIVVRNPKYANVNGVYELDVWVASEFIVGTCPPAWPKLSLPAQ